MQRAPLLLSRCGLAFSIVALLSCGSSIYFFELWLCDGRTVLCGGRRLGAVRYGCGVEMGMGLVCLEWRR